MSDPSIATTAAEVPVTPPAPAAEGSAPMASLEALEDEAKAGEETEGEDTRPFVEVRDQRFHLVSNIPAIVSLKLAAAQDPRTPQPKQMSAIVAFFEYAVVRDERDEFMEFLADADPTIEFEELGKILLEATEAIAGRPTSQ